MTTKDYTIIAKVLSQTINIKQVDDASPGYLILLEKVVDVIAHNLSIAFMVDNPRFNIDKFMEAVRGKK